MGALLCSGFRLKPGSMKPRGDEHGPGYQRVLSSFIEEGTVTGHR